MHKFYWNNTTRNRLQSSDVASTEHKEMEAGSGSSLCQQQQSTMYHPQVPARNHVAHSTMIKVEQRDQRATTPSGSHRVLLKLKKISSNRPKSMHEADLDEAEASTSSTTCEENIKAGNSNEAKKRSLPSSRSSHQFYNRTWNERSLTKYANQHNYENVYSEEDDSADQHTGHLLINQLTCSPRSARSTRLWAGEQPNACRPQPDHEIPPIPPERKGRGRRRGGGPGGRGGGDGGGQIDPEQVRGVLDGEPHRIHKPLFRSKSCERPKMRDTFRMEKFAANFNRISSNITDKLIAKPQQLRNNNSGPQSYNEAMSPTGENNSGNSSSGEIVLPQNGNSLLQTVALRAIPCVDIQANQHQNYYRPAVPEDQNFGDGDLDSISDLSVRPPTAASNSSSTTSRPSLALAHKMKGLRKDVQEKISRLRSRSAERISNKRRSLRRSSPSEERVETRASCSSSTQRSERSASINVEDMEYADLHPPYRRMTKSYSGLPTPVAVYNGPFIGRARALVDYIPSPYDRDALRFSRGDTIDIISMNPSGLWRGKSQGRVGHFKFINVELLPDRNTLRQQRRSASEKLKVTEQPAGPPQSVEDLLKRIGLEEHLSVFVLNGYEELENFHDLNEAELDYLGITEPGQRAKIMSAVDLMQDTSTLSTASDEDDETEKTKTPTKSSKESFERHNFPRDSGCFASSSPASDRSSQQSQSESGIHLPHDDDDSDESHDLNWRENSNSTPCTTINTATSSSAKSCSQSSANTTTNCKQTRERRQHIVSQSSAPDLGQLQWRENSNSVCAQELEKLQLKDAFEVLVEKYVTEKSPLHVETGRVSNTRSIFENHQI